MRGILLLSTLDSDRSRFIRFLDDGDDEGIDSEEDEEIQRQMEMEEEAENADELGVGDMGECGNEGVELELMWLG